MKLLLAAATEAEISQTLDYLQSKATVPHVFSSGEWEIDICITGVGLMPATFSFTKALLAKSYDFVLQAGIGGCFDQTVPLGSVVAIGAEMPGDLGAEDHDKFIDIFDLGFIGTDEAPFTNARLVNPMDALPFELDIPVMDGLTVHTVSGSEATIARRYSQYPATIESMEGAALHYVCLQMGVPFLQIRSISNYVTPRDRPSWQIGKAVGALNARLIKWIGAL